MDRRSGYPEEAFLLTPKKNLEIDIDIWVGYVLRRPDGLPDAVINKVEHCISLEKSQHESLTVYLMHPLYDDKLAVLFIKPRILGKPYLVRVFSANVTAPSSLVAPQSPFKVSIQPPPVQSSTPLSHNGLYKTMVLRTMRFEQKSLNDVRLAALINTRLSGAEDSGHEPRASLIGSVFDSLKDTVGCQIIEGERPQRHWRWWPYRQPLGKASTSSHEAEGTEDAEGAGGTEGADGSEGEK